MAVDGRGGARRERAVVQREKSIGLILEATKKLLRTTSALEIRSSDIAEESGLSRQTVFQYYTAPRLIFYELADRVTVEMQEVITGLDHSEPGWERKVAEGSVAILLADSAVNRQVMLISASQGRGAAAVMADTPKAVAAAFRARLSTKAVNYSSYEDDLSAMALTLCQGLIYQWAAGLLSDENFGAETTAAVEMVIELGLNRVNKPSGRV